ncbi:MAG TPA: hypothetical protein VND91_02065 [Candidatus Saccharimonadia bacterium]|nr:hypothetical protein [Candidatus Saccharimonadia bacterium]
MSPLVMLLAVVAAADPRTAACRLASPTAAAELLYRSFRDFPQRPGDAAALLSPRLLRLLERDRACSAIEQCAISSDPWTGAQDGAMLPPVTFAEMARPKHAAMVRTCYRFSLDVARNKTCAVVVVTRDAKGCWRIDDLKSPDGTSLYDTLSSYDYGD